MKKVFQAVAVFSLCLFVLCGCSSTNNTASSAEEQYADQDFMNDLAKGLEDRWKLSDEYNAQQEKSGKYDEIGSDGHIEAYTKSVNAELDRLADYPDKKFEDSKLKERAISYINCLNDQLEALDYASVDYEEYDTRWSKAYDKRTKLIARFVSDYGLTVDEKYQDTLDELLTNAKLVKEDDKQKRAVKKLIKKISFELESDDYGYKTYVDVVKNKTGYDFKTLSLSVNLLDKDGVIVETTYATVNNFKNGKKARIEFGTNKDFNSTEVTADYWEFEQ